MRMRQDHVHLLAVRQCSDWARLRSWPEYLMCTCQGQVCRGPLHLAVRRGDRTADSSGHGRSSRGRGSRGSGHARAAGTIMEGRGCSRGDGRAAVHVTARACRRPSESRASGGWRARHCRCGARRRSCERRRIGSTQGGALKARALREHSSSRRRPLRCRGWHGRKRHRGRGSSGGCMGGRSLQSAWGRATAHMVGSHAAWRIACLP